MKDLLLGQEPAFASFQGEKYSTQQGMSKRFYAACAAMQGLLANEQIIIAISKRYPNPEQYQELRTFYATLSYEYADELLKQETEIEQHDNN